MPNTFGIVELKYAMERDPKVFSNRAWNKIMAFAYDQTGIYYHKFMVPKKFTHAGAVEYGYQKRQGARGLSYDKSGEMHRTASGGDADVGKSYKGRWWRTNENNGKVYAGNKAFSTHTGRKLREKHHTYPLVWTGRTQRAALGGMDVRKTSRQVTIVLINLPSYIGQRPHGIMSPDMKAELASVSERDRDKLTKILDLNIQKGINKFLG